jgi:hypothetical protein
MSVAWPLSSALVAGAISACAAPALAESDRCAAATAAIDFVMGDAPDGKRPVAMTLGAPYDNTKVFLEIQGDPVVLIQSRSERSAAAKTSGDGAGSPPPSRETILAFMATPDTNPAADCPSFKSHASSLGVRWLGPKQEKRFSKPDRHGNYPMHFVSIGTPVINKDSSEALAYVGAIAGTLDASYGLIYLRRRADGSWRVVQYMQFLVS